MKVQITFAENATNKLVFIKIIHTSIWVIMNLVVFYLLYAVINNMIDKWILVGIGIIGLEWLVLLIFRGDCPFTLEARKYSNSTKDNFDIYLPNWLAKYNKLIYIILFAISMVVLSGQLLILAYSKM